MARFDGPIYPQLEPKILGIRALKVHNGQCNLQWKKVTLDQLFSTIHLTFHISQKDAEN
jgi:hypothetical protein